MFFVCKQKTAYEVRISDWRSDVCSSNLIPGTFPALDGDEKYVLGPMKDQILTVLNGHPGTAMAAFRDQLNDVEIASVITYTRNAWSNAGKGKDPVVQHADVKALR